MTRTLPRTLLLAALFAGAPARAGELKFERTVIDPDFPGGYQVEVADVDGDGKPDIVALGGSTVAWYQNPSWKKRLVSGREQTPDVISCATADVDRDGKAEVAIAYDFAMNDPKRGKLGLAIQGATLDDPWTFEYVRDVPSIHRVRWGDPWIHDGVPELIVAPIFGEAATEARFYLDPARLLSVANVLPRKAGRYAISEAIGDRPVIHAIRVLDVDGDGDDDVLTADNFGIGLSIRYNEGLRLDQTWSSRVLVTGVNAPAPARGCSEVHLGRLRDGRRFLATLEPWHGNQVAVYPESKPGSLDFGGRQLLDDTLDAGHALWVADVDGDGDDEVFAGHRGKDARVSAYDLDGGRWTRTVVDTAITAQDLRGGDLNADGTPDVVAIGGASKNVVWYRPIR